MDGALTMHCIFACCYLYIFTFTDLLFITRCYVTKKYKDSEMFLLKPERTQQH